MLRNLFLLLTYLLTCEAAAQKRDLSATRIAAPPRIDGQLNDAAWQGAEIATDFIQNFPNVGQPARHRTRVRVVFDDVAIYIGAFLSDDPRLIRRQLTPRDGEQRQDVDYFAVYFDTYNDQQNAFLFGVTSANVQTDARLGGSGSGESGDRSWEAVWQSATAVHDSGWAVEMRIPYISLRFTKAQIQTWGLQLQRFSRRDNETDYWNAVSPTVNGFVNQFGRLGGLRDIRSPLRLSFSPYLSGIARINPAGSGAERTQFTQNGGMDVKWGVSKSFTLDATLIPDFGQVISDNVVNNLTPYEIQFQENRPFFTEGTELFNKAGGLFYSRRIGATPSGYFNVAGTYGRDSVYELLSNPSVTRLYNAVKFSGRTPGKLGIGILNAVTAPMEARVRNRFSKQDSLIATEPLTNYSLVVLDQALKGRSSLTFTNANTIRDGNARDANTSALDWALFDKDNNYAISGTLRSSQVFGYTPWSRGQYFTNTDTVTIGGRRFLKPYDGYSGRLRLAKVGGRLRFFGQVHVESDKYDPRDLGFLQAPNELTYTAGISYHQFEPRGAFLNYNYGFQVYQTNLYRPHTFSSLEFSANAFAWFRNFWDLSVVVGGAPAPQIDFFELRDMRYRLERPAFGYVNLSGSTDSRKKLFVGFEAGYARASLAGSDYFSQSLSVRYRFSNRLLMTISFDRQQDDLQIGSAFVAQDPAVIVYRKYKEMTGILSGIYNFTPRMNLTLRARHNWSQFENRNFFRVDEKGRHLPYNFLPGREQNYNVFNLDAFYTWDFRPGSRMIVGWKNWLDGTTSLSGQRYRNYTENLFRSFGLPHGNEFTLRVIYFLDYNQLRKRKA